MPASRRATDTGHDENCAWASHAVHPLSRHVRRRVRRLRCEVRHARPAGDHRYFSEFYCKAETNFAIPSPTAPWYATPGCIHVLPQLARFSILRYRFATDSNPLHIDPTSGDTEVAATVFSFVLIEGEYPVETINLSSCN